MNDELDKLVAAHRDDAHQAPAHRVQQWHSAIDNAAEWERRRERAAEIRFRPVSVYWGLAVSAALVLGIVIGATISDRSANDSRSIAHVTPQRDDTAAAFARVFTAHLRDSRNQLSNLDSASDRTALILDIIEQNRLFEYAADRSNAPKLARVLRAFEPILLRLAATDIAPDDAEALREQLSFELNVVLTKLTRDTSDETHST